MIKLKAVSKSLRKRYRNAKRIINTQVISVTRRLLRIAGIRRKLVVASACDGPFIFLNQGRQLIRKSIVIEKRGYKVEASAEEEKGLSLSGTSRYSGTFKERKGGWLFLLLTCQFAEYSGRLILRVPTPCLLDRLVSNAFAYNSVP